MSVGQSPDPGGNQNGYLDSDAPGAKLASNWLGKLGIRDKEWSFESRLLLKRGMKARCLGGAGRCFCCLKLHTEAFGSEMAVQSIDGKLIPLTPGDVARKTGLPKQHIRRYMLQLRAWGMGDITGEQHHSVRLYLWMIPRQVDVAGIIDTDPWTAVPKDLRRWFRRFHIVPDAGFQFANEDLLDLHEAVNGYLASVEVIKSVLRRSHSGPTIQKSEKSNEKRVNGQSVGPVREPVATDRPTTNPDAADTVHDWLIALGGDVLAREDPGRTLCLQIAAAAGPMPLDYALPLTKRDRQRVEEEGFRLMLAIVRQARKRWDRDSGKRKQQAQSAEANRRGLALQLLDSEHANAADKAWAREILGIREPQNGP